VLHLARAGQMASAAAPAAAAPAAATATAAASPDVKDAKDAKDAKTAKPKKKILILGAGPTGLGAAWRLHELQTAGHNSTPPSLPPLCSGSMRCALISP
jgi:hypothetical protein